MYNTKKEIEDRIMLLETRVADSNDAAKSYTSEISALEKDLEDFNKPAIDGRSLDQIYDVICNSIEALNDLDPSDCEFDFGIDYDGRIVVESMRVTCAHDYFVDEVYNNIRDLFKVKEKEEDADTV